MLVLSRPQPLLFGFSVVMIQVISIDQVCDFGSPLENDHQIWSCHYPLGNDHISPQKGTYLSRWFSELRVWWDMLVSSLGGKISVRSVTFEYSVKPLTYITWRNSWRKFTAFFKHKKILRFDPSQVNVAVVATSTQLSVDFRPRHCNPKKVAQLGHDMACILSLLALLGEQKNRCTCWRWGIYSDFNILKLEGNQFTLIYI